MSEALVKKARKSARKDFGKTLLLAREKQAQGRHQEAAFLYEALHRESPGQVDLLKSLTIVLLLSERYKQALPYLSKLTRMAPGDPQSHSNRAIALAKEKEFEKAMKSIRASLVLKPDYAFGINNIGKLQQELGQYESAMNFYHRASILDPDFPAAHWNEAMMCLLLGDWIRGWELYEWGWKSGDRGALRGVSSPLWLGKDSIKGKRILVLSEQGFGDSIQMYRYLKPLKEKCAHVIVECAPALAPLVREMDGEFEVILKDESLPMHDYHCPIMSLPLAFGSTPETVPKDFPYLLVGEKRGSLNPSSIDRSADLRIGLAWSGNPAHWDDANRSLPLQLMRPLFSLPAVQFFVLQKEMRMEDRSYLAEAPNVRLSSDDFADFGDTAALVNSLDMVISVDTSLAHLAGALGKPVWLLLPYFPDYRWMLGSDETVWYPHARIFRQPKRGDWSDVIARVRCELAELSGKLLTV